MTDSGSGARSLELLGEAKLITCILAKGKGEVLQRLLIDEKDLHGASIRHARGVGRSAPLSSRGIGEQLEKDIVEIAVSADGADALFEFIYERMEVAEGGGAFLYQTQLVAASNFTLPEFEDDGGAES